ASRNKNVNAKSPDTAFTNIVQQGNFVDRSGATVDVKISELYDTASRGYEYDRLEPKPSLRIGGVLGPGMTFVPIGRFSQSLAEAGEPGLPLSASVTVKPQLLNSFATRLGELAIQGLRPIEAPAKLATVRITGVRAPADPQAYVRVFLNCPYLTPETPIDDPHYVSTFAFFTERGETHGAHVEEGLTYAFDITDTLDALRRSGRYPEEALKPQLLAFGGENQPIALEVAGEAKIAFLEAEKI
ncbi:MAG: hypothetical protein AB7G54_09755, partial [Methyloceanibacter sp.]